MRRAIRPLPATTKSRGFVLFVGLVMLLLLTLIGISSMQVSLLQERMAGNFKAAHSGFESAETSVKAQRSSLNTSAQSFTLDSDAPLAMLATGNVLPWQSWLDSDPASNAALKSKHYSALSSSPIKGKPQPNYYVVSAVGQDQGANGGDVKSAIQAIFLYQQ